MIDKIKTILTIALIVIVVFALGYSLVKTVIHSFEQPILVTMDNLKDYTVEENIVTSYSTFYFYEDCMNNFIEACEKEKYNELYDIYIKNYKKNQSKADIISELKNVKKILTPKDIDEEIKCNLKNVYYCENNECLAEITINDNTIYIVFGEASSKELDYNFAIVK